MNKIRIYISKYLFIFLLLISFSTCLHGEDPSILHCVYLNKVTQEFSLPKIISLNAHSTVRNLNCPDKYNSCHSLNGFELFWDLDKKYQPEMQPEIKHLMNRIKNHEKRQTQWLSAALVSSVLGGVFKISADLKYNEYLISSNSYDASRLSKRVEAYDIISPVLLGISGFCVLEFSYHTIRKNGARKKLQFIIYDQGAGMSLSF